MLETADPAVGPDGESNRLAGLHATNGGEEGGVADFVFGVGQVAGQYVSLYCDGNAQATCGEQDGLWFGCDDQRVGCL